jgi:uncharacterized protein
MPSNLSGAEALTFNVAGLLAEPAGTVREFDVSSPPLDLTVELDYELHPELVGEIQEPPEMTRGIEGHLKLTRTNRGLFVQARLTTAIAQSCSRCLRDIEWPVEIDIDEEALPVLDFASGLPVDTSAEPDLLRLTDHHELELEGEVRDAVILAEPIAPLCRPDCPGLCPICGQELGSGPHDHPDEDIDPRLEALKVFRERPES